MGDPAIGVNAWVGIGKETTWGTAVTPTDFFPFESEGIVRDIPRQFERGLDGQFTDFRWRSGTDSVGGPLPTKVYYTGMLKLFEQIFGASASVLVGGSTAAYDHTFTMVRPLPVGFTLEVGRDKEEYIYAGCKMNSAAFSCAIDGDLMLALDIFGKSEAIDASPPTPVIQSEAPFKFNEGVLTIDSVAVAVCTNFNVALNNNLRGDYYGLGSELRQGIPPNDFALIEGDMTIAFENLTYYNAFLAGTESDLTLKFTSAVEIESGYYYEAELIIDRLIWTGKTPNITGPGTIENTYPFRAIRKDASNLPLEMRVRNGVATV